MESQMAFLDCPAYLDEAGSARCLLPAHVQDRYTVRSSNGPVESARIRCPAGHCFNGPVEFLTLEPAPEMGNRPPAGNAHCGTLISAAARSTSR